MTNFDISILLKASRLSFRNLFEIDRKIKVKMLICGKNSLINHNLLINLL